MSKRNLFHLTAAGMLLLLASFAGPVCLAQTTTPPARSNVTITHVKPDMLDEWVDLQKNEVLPALKKAGVASRTTWRTVWGNGYEFLTFTPLAKYAERDEPNPLTKALGAEASARLQAKLRRCVESSQSYVSSRMEDLSNIPTTAIPPNAIVVVTRVRVAPGKAAEWANYVKTEILPVYKKANARYTVTSRGFGSNPNDRNIASYAANFAELDAGPLLTRTLGADAAAKVAAKGVGLSNVIERTVRRRVPDLSY